MRITNVMLALTDSEICQQDGRSVFATNAGKLVAVRRRAFAGNRRATTPEVQGVLGRI